MSSLAVTGYEMRRLLRDRALVGLLLLLAALGTYAAWNGRAWVEQRTTAIGLLAAEEQQMLTRARSFVGRAPSVLPRVQPVLPPGHMAAVSIGQADAYPFTADVVALGDATALFKRVWADIGSPTARAAGPLDLAFVIVFLLPLVVLAVSYDLWSRERERGVAAMVLSQPVAMGRLIAVKALARGVVVLLPATAIIVAAAAWAGARDPRGLACLAAIVLSYGSFWLAVAVLIGLRARRSTEAAIAAGAVWMLLVVMAPSLALAGIDLRVPPPSEMRLATDVKARMTEIAERERLHHLANPLRVRTPPPTIPDQVRSSYADLVATDRQLAPMLAEHRRARDARRSAMDTVRLLLPSVATQDALDRLAGADADRALAFQDQVTTFWQQRRQQHQRYLERDAPQTLAEYDALTRFEFHDGGCALRAGVLTDLAALFTAAGLLLIATWAMRGQLTTP
ncbi:ABC transporter permease subunit [Xanthomonas campestris]|uniref:ABC transporter permease subunit n=1 Tax=Xanthomonas campestris TaxID=339 RepID=UPI00096F8151|nr:ABC transporter permease subunit [Xanthomonas campestris]MCF8826464.1 ABC transporter permease subunit [Xanthomonas campestris pv. raphani]MEA9838945.1 ABC transporter permease subunit [Xanthomonas campestris pv. raphani]MEA9878465.1 ABC transporter permease subunit [Xanthomonas campestris pv. raphani]MEA9894892.1 ABC transporter permease subunit [Xanthomonas campestris pv. raphani]MEA9934526.1 ABC transporter permease subunit [Xanthomonas campestris pv. raphani]